MKLILFSLCLLAARASAAPIEIALRVSSTTVALGQPVAVEAVAALPADAKLSLDLERSTTDYFSIAKAEDGGVTETGGARAQHFSLEVLPLALGKMSVDLYWNSESPSGKSPLAEPSKLVLDVKGPEFQGKEAPTPVDIKEPRAASPALWPWLLAALIGAALWEIYRRLKAGAGVEPPSIPVDDRPAEVIALSELDALESSGLWSQGKFKEFYFNLTEVMRQYLERRYGMPATRLTTSELYREMRQVELDRPLTALFKDILDRADLVKFAKIAPEADWGGKDVAGARSFVAQTTPHDLTPAVEEAKK